jgi:predicted transcriptional regulator
MNHIEVTVMTPQSALDTFADTWRHAKEPQAVTPRLAFSSLHELFSAITEKRLELLRHVGSHPGLDVHALAHTMGWDEADVRADAAQLVELGLLEQDEQGGLSAPFDEIVIHAPIRSAA